MKLGKEILRRLQETLEFRENEFVSLVANKSGNPFEVLVATIISQNTNDRNTIKAMNRLKTLLGRVDPEKIEELPLKKLEEILKPAGLYRQKAKVIKEAASFLKEGKLNRILRIENLEEARKELMSLPGVGPKTADVVLSLTSSKPTIAVDRHIARISLRLGLVKNDNYNDIRNALISLFCSEDYLKAHLLLIKLGRTYCRPKNPKCDKCPLRDLCEYARKSGRAGKSK